MFISTNNTQYPCMHSDGMYVHEETRNTIRIPDEWCTPTEDERVLLWQDPFIPHSHGTICLDWNVDGPGSVG